MNSEAESSQSNGDLEIPIADLENSRDAILKRMRLIQSQLNRTDLSPEQRADFATKLEMLKNQGQEKLGRN